MIPALILAAGASQRMHGPLKPLLPWKNGNFLTAAIGMLRVAGLCDLVVVLGCRAEEVRRAVDLQKVTVVVNEQWETGMLSSMRAGLAVLPAGAPGALVTLVDLPAIRPETVRALITAWQADRTRLVLPLHHGRRGHPVIVPAALFEKLRRTDYADGPRGLLREEAARLAGVAVDDPGCVSDVDTPEDYASWREKQRENGAEE